MTRIQKQIEKRVSKKQKLQNRKKLTKTTWTFHGCSLNPLLYPLGVLVVLYEEHKSRKYKEMEWSESKAEVMANRYFGKVCDIDDDGSLWYCTEWGNTIWRNRSNRFDKRWLNKFGHKMHTYIVETFEIEGYKKDVESNYYESWVHFIPLD